MAKSNGLSLSTAFKNLKQGLLGIKSDKIDTQIDSALDRIRTYSNTSTRNAYIENMKDMVTNVGDPVNNDFLKDINQIGGIDAFQQGDRVTRYKEYDEIVRNIAYCERALKVLTDNILSPDDITKRSLKIVNDETLYGKNINKMGETIMSRIKEINKVTQIENHLEKLVKTTMKKGDYFIEILHSPKGENALIILNENKDQSNHGGLTLETHTIDGEEIKLEGIDEKGRPTTVIKRNNIILEYIPSFGGVLGQRGPTRTGAQFTKTHSDFNIPTHSKDPNQKNVDADVADGWEDNLKNKFEKDKKDEKDEKDKDIKLSDIFVTLHDPQYVIRLETERFRTCLGYLVFPKVDGGQQFSNMWVSTANTVDSICLKIIEKLEERIGAGKDNLPRTGDLREIVAKYLKGIKDQEDLKIRYVPPEKMSHWRISPELFEPYGQSIFESVKFDCKLFMALKTAMTIKRLTSATDKRVVKIETGLPRNAKNLIEMLREGLRKRKISIDKFGSVDTIPSHITTFEDIYIPMRDGKEFVTIDSMQFGPDPQQDVEPLKFMRDNIAANLMVPPAFIGLEENVSNRALLTVENILFARTIVSYQSEFSFLLKDFFEKIYLMVYPNGVGDLDSFSITFPPPKASTFEHEMEYLEQLQRIMETLEGMGIPKDWTKKKYLPEYDWDEIEKAQAEEQLKKELGVEKPTDGAAGGYGSGF